MRIDRVFALILMLGFIAGCVTVDKKQTDNEAASNVNTELGQGYLEQRDYETANVKLERALRYNPKNPKANYLYAVLQEELGQLELAEYHYKTASKLDPKNSSAAYAYGRFLCRNQREAESEKYFQTVLKDPFYKVPEFTLTTAAICMMQIEEIRKAEEYLSRALKEKRNYPPALYNMANLKFVLADYEQAKVYIDLYHLAARANASSLWLAIRTSLKLDRESDISELSLRLEKDFPDSPEYQEWLKIQ